MLRRALCRLLQAVLLLQAMMAVGWAASIEQVRIWPAPDHTRLVFDLSDSVSHSLFTLSNPERIVIDIKGSQVKAVLADLDLSKTPIKAIRSGKRADGVRIVLDLQRRTQPRSFDLLPNDKYGHRLVVDLVDTKPKPAPAKAAPSMEGVPLGNRNIIIAIDAGHGGEDPGAIGPEGVKEKVVVLAIAKKLARLLEQEPGFKPVLIRDGDYYVGLRDRTRKARKGEADLFVSIHADAFKNHRARGASVWTLSSRGASSEMGRWLAGRENSVDLIGGVGTLSKDSGNVLLEGVLLDMSMNSSISHSREAGGYIQAQMSSVAHMHKKTVQYAGFMVLKSPDIPSILIETGFISNPREARLLQDSGHQHKLAQSIFNGIKTHFSRKPPPSTLLATRLNAGGGSVSSYRVSRGDTLSEIASRNQVAMKRLREFNGLSSDLIRVGQLLKIPAF
ncbi:MAG: N-acetylmuramoyl-L-alanine amidase [Motiliproteus sp.]